MPTLSLKVVEKWSKSPIPDTLLYVNDKYMDKTDERGELSIEMTTGSAKIEAKKVGYEDHVQALVLAANTALNITLTPIVGAL